MVLSFRLNFLLILFLSNLILTISTSEKNAGDEAQNFMSQKPLNIIKLADTDGDGKVSLDKEMKQFLESDKFERIFKVLFDHQPNGELRVDSFKKILSKHFAGRRYSKQLPNLVDEVNVNGNGGIDWHEFKLFTYELGKQMIDANHDGFITAEESQAFYAWEYMFA